MVRELAYLDSLDDFKNFCNIFYTIRKFDLHGLSGAQSWRICLF